MKTLRLLLLASAIQFLNLTGEAAVLYPPRGGGGGGGTINVTNAFVTNLTVLNNAMISNLYVTNMVFNGQIITNIIQAVGPGTPKRVAMFDYSTTNVTDSSLFNTATNQVEFRQTNAVSGYSSAMTNFVVMSEYTNATGWRGFAISAVVDGGIYMEQLLGSGVNPATFPRGGIRFNEAWAINGYGSTQTGDGGGKTPDFLPIGDNVHDIGDSTSRRVRSFNAGELGFAASANGSAPNFKAAGSGFGISASAIDVWNSNGPRKTASFYPISGLGSDFSLEFYSPAGVASGSPLFSPDVYMHRPITYRMWCFGTNNNSTTKSPPVIIGGGNSDDNAADRAGGDLVVVGGPASGAGTNGDVHLSTFYKGSTGFGYSTLQTNRLTIHSMPANLTESSDTMVFNVALASGKVCGIRLMATTKASDGTDHQVVTETLMIAAANKGGTVTTTVSAPSPQAILQTSGTLTTTWTAVANGNSIDVKVNAVSSLTQTSLFTLWRVEIDGDGTIATTPNYAL